MWYNNTIQCKSVCKEIFGLNKAVTRYMWTLAVMTMLTALYNSELITIACAALFTVAALLFPFGITAAAGALCTFIYAFLSVDMASGAIQALSFILPATVMAAALKRKGTLSYVVSAGTASRAAMLVLYYYHTSVAAHTTVKELMTGGLSETLSYQLSAMGYDTAVEETALSIAEFAGNLIPAVILTSALVFAFLTFAMLKVVIRRTGGMLFGIRPMGEICADRGFALAAVLVFAVSFFTEGTVSYVLLNALYFIYVIFMGFGIAATTRLLKKLFKHGAPAFVLSAVVAFVTGGVVPAIFGIVSPFVGKSNNKKYDSEKGIDENESGTGKGC